MDNETLILKLIKDELINTKLVEGLCDLGLNADDYSLHLMETIFSLMEFKDTKKNDILYEKCYLLTHKVREINIIEHPEELNDLVSRIHLSLIEAKMAGF